jgi:hypothetical protein
LVSAVAHFFTPKVYVDIVSVGHTVVIAEWHLHVTQFDVRGSMHRKRIFKYNQQDATLHNLFISVKCSTHFRRFLHPSSGAQNCIYSIGYFVKPLLLPVTVSSNSSKTAAGSSTGLTKYLMLYTEFWAHGDGWRNRLKRIEHFTEINKLCKVASCWLCLKIRLRCRDPRTSNVLWRFCKGNGSLLHKNM